MGASVLLIKPLKLVSLEMPSEMLIPELCLLLKLTCITLILIATLLLKKPTSKLPILSIPSTQVSSLTISVFCKLKCKLLLNLATSNLCCNLSTQECLHLISPSVSSQTPCPKLVVVSKLKIGRTLRTPVKLQCTLLSTRFTHMLNQLSVMMLMMKTGSTLEDMPCSLLLLFLTSNPQPSPLVLRLSE